jgi:hypothetical protein
MPTDLEIIKELEKEISKELAQLEQTDFIIGTNGYLSDDNKNIRGLSLYGNIITKIRELKKLKNFNRKYNEKISLINL